MKLLSLNKLLKLKQPWQSSECSSLLVCIISTTAIYMCVYISIYIYIYIHTHTHVGRRQEPQHMCCINKKSQLEFLTLPSQVKGSCVPGQNTPLWSYFIKNKHRASPCSRFSIQNPTTQELHELAEASQLPNTPVQLMVTLCACQCCVLKSFVPLLCSRKGSEQPIPPCSHGPQRSCE